MLRHIKRLFPATFLVVLLTSALSLVAVPSQAVVNTCGADPSQLCAPMSALTFTTNGVTNGSTSVTASLSATKFDYRFTSSATTADKYVAISFFDITPGLTLLPAIGAAGSSTSCQANAAIAKQCVIKTDQNGSASFSVSLFGVSVGSSFSYLIIGPAGYASDAVTVVFNTDGSNQLLPGICNADRSKVCSNITNLSMFVGDVKMKSATEANGSLSYSVAAGTSLARFVYQSDVAYAHKWAFVKFFGLTSGLNIVLDTGQASLGTSCDLGDAIGNNCRIRLDDNGAASFYATFAGTTLNSAYSFELSGPSYDSKVARVTFAATSVVAAQPSPSATVKASGGTVVVTVSNAKNSNVIITLVGTGDYKVKPTSSSVQYLFPRNKGSHKVTVKIGNSLKSFTVKVK